MSGHEKVLWKRPDHPDSYISPDSFLSSLRKNPNFHPYTYWDLVPLSFAVTQHLATIFVFLSAFVHLKEGTLDPRTLVWITSVCFVLGYLVWEIQDYASGRSALWRVDRVKHLKSSILIFLSLMSLSPVLKTLTAATSSDSIWALSACLFILHALLADYGSTAPYAHAQERLTSVLSMNAAISSSVVLASRLQEDLAVFSLILFSVQVFALFPILRRRFQHSHLIARVFLTISLMAASLLLTVSLSRSVTLLYMLVFVFVTFVAPGALVWAQKYKNEIRGPWDVAVPKVN
ncbi:phosphatidylinositol N-acetylglucosaminyltransferase [Hymenopellis radicata]|nr:phosphatidylinositol N-acetylglucosaminyltransferase [Hymenopellis radicata]